MARRFYSDLSGDKLPLSGLTTLRISRGSPLAGYFPGGEVHLGHGEAERLAVEFFGRRHPPGTVAGPESPESRSASAADLPTGLVVRPSRKARKPA